MRLAIVGDTHGKIKEIKQLLKKLNLEGLIFTGDYFRDGKAIANYIGLDYYGVYGNCDTAASSRYNEQRVYFEGNLFYIVHGHQYQVKNGLQSLINRGIGIGADVVVFGHTHIPLCTKVAGMWIINPGSPSRPRSNIKGSYVLVDVKKEQVFPRICYL